MVLPESGGGPKFDLPEELLEVLPSDPFDQLDVARKITSIALSTRVSALESEASDLRRQLNDRDAVISDLESLLESLDASQAEAAEKLAAAEEEKENLLRENAQLSRNMKKLQRDVAKSEAFRKKLMQSLQEDEDGPASVPYAPRVTSIAEDDATSPPIKTAYVPSQYSSSSEAVRPRISRGLLVGSPTSTPRLTPPGSPKSLSAPVSPSKTPKSMSPRLHSISFSPTKSVFDDVSSVSSSHFSSRSSFNSGYQSGKTRVDGKEFFRQVRNRLSYDQFGAFLATVKELNSNGQTKEETLRKAGEILGLDNKDLYAIFERLVTSIVH